MISSMWEPQPNVTPVLRFFEDLTFLSQFFEAESPPSVMGQSQLLVLIVYGFGDASGKGFGSTFTAPNCISYCIGVCWKPDEPEESSNWHKFTNIVESLEEDEAETGKAAQFHRLFLHG